MFILIGLDWVGVAVDGAGILPDGTTETKLSTCFDSRLSEETSPTNNF